MTCQDIKGYQNVAVSELLLFFITFPIGIKEQRIEQPEFPCAALKVE